MKKVAILVLIVIIAAGGWYFASPLILNEVVDEDFPIVNEVMEKADEDEENEEVPVISMDDNQLTQSEIDAMSEEEKMEMERKIIEEMADEPDTVMAEEKPSVVRSCAKASRNRRLY